jgi:hypothetical protein
VPRPISDGGWVSVHAFYQDDADNLLRGVVGPLVADLAANGIAEEFFFLRYWDGGPHLRLRVRPLVSGDRATVERIVCGRFEEYLSRAPSEDRLSATDYARAAEALAHREGLASYMERPYPNNTALLVPYRREHDRYGHGAAMDAVERHFVESSRIALRAVRLRPSTGQRLAVAYAVLLLSRFVGGGSLGTPPAGGDSRTAAVFGLAGRMRALAAGAATSTRTGTLIDWARSLITLSQGRTAAAADGPTADIRAVLDLCAHLICNRLGLYIDTESAIRAVLADALDSGD